MGNSTCWPPISRNSRVKASNSLRSLNLATAMVRIHHRAPAMLHGNSRPRNSSCATRPRDIVVGYFGAARLPGAKGVVEGEVATPVVSVPEVIWGREVLDRGRVICIRV
mmetsp:Transcript_18134/g.45846  ORF Transcript_18134/g.45846 Transcript_18134/m.45846 type:complete len:109 (+) Transcript_18134:220-546(+)